MLEPRKTNQLALIFRKSFEFYRFLQQAFWQITFSEDFLKLSSAKTTHPGFYDKIRVVIN